MAQRIKTSAIKRVCPSIVWIDMDGDREAWKILIVKAALARNAIVLFCVVVRPSIARIQGSSLGAKQHFL